MNPENPKLKAYLAMKLEICQMSTEDLVEFNDEVLKNSTFDTESKVRKLIETHLPDESFHLSLVALTSILLDVTNQKMVFYRLNLSSQYKTITNENRLKLNKSIGGDKK